MSVNVFIVCCYCLSECNTVSQALQFLGASIHGDPISRQKFGLDGPTAVGPQCF